MVGNTFINEKGIKWQLNKTATDYASQIGLREVSVWKIETPEGECKLIIVQGNAPVYESGTLDGIGAHLDIMRMAECN